MWLRVRNSRTCADSGENREPITRIARAALLSSTDRRAMNAARIVSLNAGCAAITCRNESAGTMRTSPSSTTRADTKTPLPGEHVQLAEEAARVVANDHTLVRAGTGNDLHATREDHEEVVAHVTLPVEELAGRHDLPTSECLRESRAPIRRGWEMQSDRHSSSCEAPLGPWHTSSHGVR